MAKRNRVFQLTKEQQMLAAKNANLARSVAWKYSRSTEIDYATLESAAFEGLCQAAAKYDPELINEETGRPMKFSSLAVPYIRGGILHFIRDKTYSMRLTHRMREVWSKGRKLMNKGMTDIEVSMALDVSLKEWQDAKSACSGPPLELKDQATPSSPPEIEEIDCLTVFQQEAQEILDRMPDQFKKKLARFCRSRSADVPTALQADLNRHLGSC